MKGANTFAQPDVVTACQQTASLLSAVADLNLAAVMLAIAAVESGGGDVNFAGNNCGPRREPVYDVGGAVYLASPEQRGLVAKFGAAAACSYGPWQMMFDNYSGVTPTLLLSQLQPHITAFVRQFNNYVVGCRKAQSLADIGEIWNMGHIAPDPAYLAKLIPAYKAALNLV